MANCTLPLSFTVGSPFQFLRNAKLNAPRAAHLVRVCDARSFSAGCAPQRSCFPRRIRPTSNVAGRQGSIDEAPWLVLAPRAAIAAESDIRSKPKLGFLGAGIMGVPMIKNLLAAGFEVTVWNRTASKCDPALEAGASLGTSAKAVVEACDITFAMLADPEAALNVAIGPQGVAAGMTQGKGYVDVSTVDSSTSQKIAAAVRSKGGQFLEAPVSGSKKPAEDGQLIFLTACALRRKIVVNVGRPAQGDQALYNASIPMLEAMGKAHFFLGDVGKGAEMKLVVNMVMGSMMAAFSEGLELGRKSGLKQSQILEVMAMGAIANPMFAVKGPSMIRGDFPPAFPLKHQQKDLRLALSLGEAVGQELPVAAATNEVYKRARLQNLDDSDFSAIIKAIQ